MKQGDKVTCTTHPGVWTLVWYKEGDNTCAIQNDKYRYIVKVTTLRVFDNNEHKNDFETI